MQKTKGVILMEHDKVKEFRDALFCNDVYTPQEARRIAESCIDYLQENGYEVTVRASAGDTAIEAVKTEVL